MTSEKIIYHTSGSKKGKIKHIEHTDYTNIFFWDYEEQTKIKHKVFENYFFVWATKLGKYHNINYFDGFSGCGAYYDRKEKCVYWGSPIIAKIKAKEANRDSHCKYYLNEKEKTNIENLYNVFKQNNLNIDNIEFIEGDFETNISSFLDNLEKTQKNNPVPTFFMIDPFGINVKYETIKRIMSIPKTEIIFNFMYNYLNRFLTNNKSASGIIELFGTNKWNDFLTLKDERKEEALVNLFREQLKKFSKYVYQYRLSFPDIDKTYYYLFHLTQNIEGCSIMKDAFASVNMGYVEFLGPNQPNPNQLKFIDSFDFIKDSLINSIYHNYKGKRVKLNEIIDYYIDSTPYLQKQIEQATRSMKNEYYNLIKFSSKTRVPKPEDTLEFFEVKKEIIRITQQKLF